MLGRDGISAVVESLFAIENLGVREYCKPFYSWDIVASIQHNNCSAFEKQQNNDVGWPWKLHKEDIEAAFQNVTFVANGKERW